MSDNVNRRPLAALSVTGLTVHHQIILYDHLSIDFNYYGNLKQKKKNTTLILKKSFLRQYATISYLLPPYAFPSPN